MAAQPIWAILMAVTALARFAVLVINGKLARGSPHLRSGLAFVSAVIWSFLFAGLLTFHKPLLLGPFMISAIVFEAANSYRAAQDARKEDDAVGVENGTSG
jgi:hypothetical protein